MRHGTAFHGDRSATKSALLDVVGEVKTRVQDQLGMVDFPIPQFILIGKQSVGKSRLIESLAGEQFNFVSGTLGSRRPTVLEFRNVPMNQTSRWSVLDRKTGRWSEYPLDQVMQIIGQAHECLGATVTDEPVNVRVESAHCVDMQVVDLPGFREFALDMSKQQLAAQIEALVTRFMKDERNVMLCVEECGDAANMATLSRCKAVDSNFKRTVLIRTKLDKYFKDLSAGNVNEWLGGHGDLPGHLQGFALTLPHWKDGSDCPCAFAEMREQMDSKDVRELQQRGVSAKFGKTVGFSNFARYMESRIEEMFCAAVVPLLKRLREMRDQNVKEEKEIAAEIENTNPSQILSVVRDAGTSFGHALNHVMEGFVRSDKGRMTLEEELRAFHKVHEITGSEHLVMLPSEDFGSLDDYIEYLRSEIKVPAFDVEVNGGAQFRRLMFEVEVFLRFSEISVETKKKDVIQARGVSMSSLTWRDVVVKLLSNEAHIPMQKRVQYVGERIRWFFEQQKEVIIDFMDSLRGSADQQMYSTLYGKNVKLIHENEMIKQLVFETFDKAVARQLQQFVDLFDNTLASTFSNPWVFLKRASTALDSEPLEDICLPSFDDTKSRIPGEIESRGGIETVLSRWLADIPTESHQIDEAVDKVQMLVLKTFSFIRAQLSDQVELFAESFFKLPMMRRLEEDMSQIELSESDRETYQARRDYLQSDQGRLKENIQGLNECVAKLQAFAMRTQSRTRGGA